ncbi:ATP-binding protein [Streptomyces bacillaris]|uniref:ATP-binding protein n=1 Tax=Streptomyces bacillaris TaxID=68179 RepID=UPI00335A05B0
MRQSATARSTPSRTSRQGWQDGPKLADLEAPHDQPFQAAFAPDLLQVREMRRATRILLRRKGVPEPTIDDAELVVSELVTNAIQHGGSGGEVCFCVSASNGMVRVSVTDQNSVPAVPKQVGTEAESGRGLMLVAAIADQWCISEDGTTVHCALAVPERVA